MILLSILYNSGKKIVVKTPLVRQVWRFIKKIQLHTNIYDQGLDLTFKTIQKQKLFADFVLSIGNC